MVKTKISLTIGAFSLISLDHNGVRKGPFKAVGTGSKPVVTRIDVSGLKGACVECKKKTFPNMLVLRPRCGDVCVCTYTEGAGRWRGYMYI